ncbi:MerR family transcriptional regulator [Symbioplanes lichenis]|uniref:MerR family transcriptional regulator n=1 Tax=Symbioplanes lichenis TaxID=1629072 RepID=UPI002738EC8A|nr:MerR family transcriptional regulator [Actinoplanes lichenis]
MTLATEEERTTHVFELVDELEDIASTPNLAESVRARLQDLARRELTRSEPVRVAVAAKLLGLSERSVRNWAKEGVLTPAETDSPRLLLDPERLHEVMRLIKDLRKLGKNRDLIDLVWYRLSDHALLQRGDLLESLEQMARGEGRRVR